MTRDAICQHAGLMTPDFVEVQGKIFVVWGKAGARRVRREFLHRKPLTVDENTHNHQHFTLFDSTTIDGVHSNWAIAEATRLIWNSLLTLQFPEHEYRLFVLNEFAVDDQAEPSVDLVDGDEVGVLTTLRLWTVDPETQDSFDSVYRPDEMNRDNVFWHQFPCEKPWPLEKILEINCQGTSHPAHQEAPRRQKRSN